jgi:hypothetical protein
LQGYGALRSVTTEESFEELADLDELFPGGAYGPGADASRVWDRDRAVPAPPDRALSEKRSL